jgi:hypothetical protein
MRSFECNKFGGRDVCSLLAKRVLYISETTVLIVRPVDIFQVRFAY